MPFSKIVTLKAFAKINLSLNITGVLENGYHTLEMLMQSVSLHDTVTLSLLKSGDGITLDCSLSAPCPTTQNTAYKAAELFFKHCGIAPGVCIYIKKQIPAQAGLAGGSADAAAVLHGLNRLLQTQLSLEQLCKIGVQIGADVPFCLCGGTMLAQSIGELLTPLAPLPDCHIVICKPDHGVNTKEAYRAIDRSGILQKSQTTLLQKALCEKNIALLAQNMNNVFEEALVLPQVKQIKQVLCQNGALGACMSGSGSAVFGIFQTEAQAVFSANLLKQRFTCVFHCRPTTQGVEFI